MFAAMFDRTEIIELFIERGADINAQSANGMRAVDYAQTMNAGKRGKSVKRKNEAVKFLNLMKNEFILIAEGFYNSADEAFNALCRAFYRRFCRRDRQF